MAIVEIIGATRWNRQTKSIMLSSYLPTQGSDWWMAITVPNWKEILYEVKAAGKVLSVDEIKKIIS